MIKNIKGFDFEIDITKENGEPLNVVCLLFDDYKTESIVMNEIHDRYKRYSDVLIFVNPIGFTPKEEDRYYINQIKNNQKIMTTYSPIVLSKIDRESIFHVKYDDAIVISKCNYEPKYLTYSDIYHLIFKTRDICSEERNKKLMELAELDEKIKILKKENNRKELKKAVSQYKAICKLINFYGGNNG